MTYMVDGAGTRAVAGGIKVEKTTTATTAATQSLFTVTGHIVVVGLIGECTVAFDGTVTSINVNHDPTIGAAADLCAATVVTSDVAGTVYSYLGDVRTTLLVSSGTVVPTSSYTQLPNTRQVLTPGVIGYVGTAADAGTVLWRLIYWPLSDDGAVVAA